MKFFILLTALFVSQVNIVSAAQKPELLGFECKKEFNVGVTTFDGIQTISGSANGGVIKNFTLFTGVPKDGYPTASFTGYRSIVSKNLDFAIVFFRDAKGYHGTYRYYKIVINITKPAPKAGEWSDYNNKGILSEALVGEVLESANEYVDQPEMCRIKLTY